MTEYHISKQFPLLSEKNLRETLLEHCSVHTFERDTVLMEEGSYVKLLPLVFNGRVKVFREEDSKEILLYYIGSGESCIMSISACVQAPQSRIKAVVEEKSEIILVPTLLVNKWLTVFPSWNMFIMDSYRIRFDNVLDAFNAVAFNKLDKRLINYLKQKAHPSNTIQITHQQIANELNTARPVISRLLKALENQGKIKLLRGAILIIKL